MPDEVVPLRKAATNLTELARLAEGDAELAYRLTLSGLSWPEAAAQAGFSDPTLAALAVTAHLSRVAIVAADQARQARLELEVARLDYLQLKWWDAATEGVGVDVDGVPLGLDDKAANVVLKVIAMRAKLLGLDVPATEAKTTVQTIVINGTTEEYVAGLKALDEGPSA